MTDLTTLLASNDARPASAPDFVPPSPLSSSSSTLTSGRKSRSSSLSAGDGSGIRALHDATVAVTEGVRAVRASLQLVGDANAACGDALVDESQPDTACARQAVQKTQDLTKRLDALLVGVGHALQEGVVDAFAQLPPLPLADANADTDVSRAAALAVNAYYVRSFQTTLRALQFVLFPSLHPPLSSPSFLRNFLSF